MHYGRQGEDGASCPGARAALTALILEMSEDERVVMNLMSPRPWYRYSCELNTKRTQKCLSR